MNVSKGDVGHITGHGHTDIIHVDLEIKKVVKRFEMEDIIGEDKQSSQCSSLAIQDGRLYVLDTGNHRLYTLYEEDAMELLHQLQSPSGLAVDKRGVIYVADSGNNRILILSKDWKLIGELCVDTGLHYPVSLCLDTHFNEMVVHNAESREIFKYSLGEISNIV